MFEHLPNSRAVRQEGTGQVLTLNTFVGVEGDEALLTRVLVIAQRRTQLFLLDHILQKLSISMLDIAWESFTLDFETALISALNYLSTVAFVVFFFCSLGASSISRLLSSSFSAQWGLKRWNMVHSTS
jgi:hypothetical protein